MLFRSARAVSRGNTVPVIRTAFHIGSHYELYQAEGVNPTVFSYIVGDVTIELARMVDLAQGRQILMGDFNCEMSSRGAGPGSASVAMSTAEFVSTCCAELGVVLGTQLSGKRIASMTCFLTENEELDGSSAARRFRIIDKHGLSRHAYNLQIGIDMDDKDLALGLDESQLPQRGTQQDDDEQPPSELEATDTASAEELFDDLASMLRKRSAKTIIEIGRASCRERV